MQSVLGKAVEQYRRQAFLAECHAAYAALVSDPSALVALPAEKAEPDSGPAKDSAH